MGLKKQSQGHHDLDGPSPQPPGSFNRCCSKAPTYTPAQGSSVAKLALILSSAGLCLWWERYSRTCCIMRLWAEIPILCSLACVSLRREGVRFVHGYKSPSSSQTHGPLWLILMPGQALGHTVFLKLLQARWKAGISSEVFFTINFLSPFIFL